ncbi:NifB/NifX family molybdenum-iron cluster-binding protein [Algibacter sp. R77976]|uniref:NifB/NifX family molybdenum-iron cluster-binding protein n=1 Tax=Algibacter sp. R77976 TaxID=3093873 RepID=UPI0037C9DF77
MKKIAIPITSDNTIEDHFGHSQFYEIYTFSNNNEIVDLKLLESEPGCGCKSNIVSVLADEGVSFMLSGNIGNGAMNKLNKAGIGVIRGCSGKSADIILQYVEGEISDSGISCSHHDKKHKKSHKHTCNH